MPLVLSGADGVSGVDGTASNPSYEGTDSNTGIFFPAADTVAIGTGGTEALRVNSAQNVGIGTSSLTANNRMTLNASSGNNGFEIQNSGDSNRGGRLVATGSAASGTFAINTTSSGYALTFGIDSAERARITSGGEFLFGKTSSNLTDPGVYVEPTNIGYGRVNFIKGTASGTGSTSTCAFYYNGTQIGTITNTSTATAYNTSSDYRLKENVQPMTGALAKVAALKPCTYTWKVDGSNGQGFIAHELAEVVPDAVTGEKDAVNEDGSIKPQGIDTSFLVATLTAAIQEQQAMIDEMKAEIAALKGAA